MNDAFAFSTEPDEELYVAANALVVRNGTFFRRPWLICLGAWALFVGLSLLPFGVEISLDTVLAEIVVGLVWALVMIALMFPFTRFVSARLMRKQVRDLVKIAPVTHFRLTSETLHSENAIATQTLRWDQFKRVMEDKRLLVLMVTNMGMVVIPKSIAGAEAVEFLRSRLIAAGVPLG